MLFLKLLLVSAALVKSATVLDTLTNAEAARLLNISQGLSTGKIASCVTALVPIDVSSTNTQLALENPMNQTVVTEIFQELVQVNSTIAARTIKGPKAVRATYNIEATLCFPKDTVAAKMVQTVQILTYGIGLDKSYWDIAPGYSYVDAAASAGYATLAYNRLGVGQSAHPDPIQDVQCAIDVEILHHLVLMLRNGHLGSRSFKYVIGVGHSYGSIVQLAQNAKYPKDVDAAVLTAFTSNVANLPYTVLANNPSIARINNPREFGALPNGYLVHDTAISIQLPFFRYPYFDPNSKFIIMAGFVYDCSRLNLQ